MGCHLLSLWVDRFNFSRFMCLIVQYFFCGVNLRLWWRRHQFLSVIIQIIFFLAWFWPWSLKLHRLRWKLSELSWKQCILLLSQNQQRGWGGNPKEMPKPRLLRWAFLLFEPSLPEKRVHIRFHSSWERLEWWRNLE